MADPINITVLQGQLETIKTNIDAFFILTMACIVFFMQCGFAFLEAGSVRSKNTTNILLKNVLDSFVSGLAYWAIGYPLAFGGGNFFVGHNYWFSAGLPTAQYHMWFFHFVFAATAATIVSGALAERCDFIAYFVYSFMITGFVYPVVVHWAWAPEGWLFKGDGNIGYQDFAGSGVVHLLGGTAALVGAVFLGPRQGRFDEVSKEVRDIPGHSVPLMSLGGFILFFGFFAFNGGSQASISQPGDAEAVSLAILNTVISGTFAAFTAMLGQKIGSIVCGKAAASQSTWSLLVTINGALTGMVAVCSGCNVYYPWGACIVGIIAGFAFLAWSWLLIFLKVDDPLSAVAVHAGGGMWGVIATPILQRDKGIVFTGNRDSFLALGWNLAGMAAIIAWSGTICIIMFGILKAVKILRVDPEIEKNGLDIPKHGEPAYPPEAWGDGWGKYHVDETMKIVRRMSRQMGLQPIPDSILEKACDELKRDMPATNPHASYGSSELNRMHMFRKQAAQYRVPDPVYEENEENEENEYSHGNSIDTLSNNVDHENNHHYIENTQL